MNDKQLEFDFSLEKSEHTSSLKEFPQYLVHPLTADALLEAFEHFKKTFLSDLNFDEDEDFERDIWRLKYGQ